MKKRHVFLDKKDAIEIEAFLESQSVEIADQILELWPRLLKSDATAEEREQIGKYAAQVAAGTKKYGAKKTLESLQTWAKKDPEWRDAAGLAVVFFTAAIAQLSHGRSFTQEELASGFAKSSKNGAVGIHIQDFGNQ